MEPVFAAVPAHAAVVTSKAVAMDLVQRPNSVPSVLQQKAERMLERQAIARHSHDNERQHWWKQQVNHIRGKPLFNDYVHAVEARLSEPLRCEFLRYST